MNQSISFDLKQLFNAGYFSDLDYQFAITMARLFKEENAIVKTSCALICKALANGHICLNIEKIDSKLLSNTTTILKDLPDPITWINVLKKSELVSNEPHTPLVIDEDNNLYLARYYDFQSRLSKSIANRVSQPCHANDPNQIEKIINSFFEKSDTNSAIQKEAVKHVLQNRFTIISGGPGTGKTFVTKIIEQAFKKLCKVNAGQVPVILNLAPTGKAASKMENGRTIHSVLKPLKHEIGFYHNKKNPLIADLVIIDEASMIDMALLTRLFEAISPNASIVLSGDKNQLASVQAGSVFSDICAVSSIQSHLFVFEYNFRSKGQTGIEKLSAAINGNDTKAVENILRRQSYPDIEFLNLESPEFDSKFQKIIKTEYIHINSSHSIDEAIGRMDIFKVLCAVNSGKYGRLSIGHLCENILRSEANSGISDKPFYKIIMVNANDYKTGVFNGDTGILVEHGQTQIVYFKKTDGSINQIRKTDLPGYDPAFAITIHKSQGSEYDTVLILIPEKQSAVITRQLLYTGVTRARKKVIIAGKIDIIKQATGILMNSNSGITRHLERDLLNLNEKNSS